MDQRTNSRIFTWRIQYLYLRLRGITHWKSMFNAIYKPHLILKDNISQVRRDGMVLKIYTLLFSENGVFKVPWVNQKNIRHKLAKSPRGWGFFFLHGWKFIEIIEIWGVAFFGLASVKNRKKSPTPWGFSRVSTVPCFL